MKKIKRISIYFLYLLVMMNVSTYYFIKFRIGDGIYEESYRLKKRKYLMDESRSTLVHPFVGNVNVSDTKFISDASIEPMFHSISSYKEDNPIKVLILGGSVAQHITKSDNYSRNILFEELNNQYKTRRFEVFNASISGGKQPQQLAKLLYLDLLGFNPDIVINIDGFNEVALTLSENDVLNLPQIFPRSFSRLVESIASDRSCASLNNELLNIDSLLPLVELTILGYAQYCQEKISGTRTDIAWWTKYYDSPITKEKKIDQMSTIWARSNNKIFQQLRYRNIPYIHIIQPNQYLEGSKNFTIYEVNELMNLKSYGSSIKNHYNDLNTNKLNYKSYLDQRYLFVNESRQVYVDNCCHFNDLGSTLIVNNILKNFHNVFLNALEKN